MKKKNEKKYSVGKIIWLTFVALISIASLVEVIVGFIPCEEEHQVAIRLLFMGFTLIGTFYSIVDYLFVDFRSKNDISKWINEGLILSKEDRIDEMSLFKIENNLDSCFGSSGEQYHIIIISSCVSNEEHYINAMWKNINNGVKYLYVTPDSDQAFIDTLLDFFLSSFKGDPTEIYKIVTSNISHICNKEIFTVLPLSFDLWLGLQDKNRMISMETYKGFVCFAAKETLNGQVYSYVPISKDVVETIFNEYKDSFEAEKLLQPYFSDKIDVNPRASSIDGRGLFAKQGITIKKGELLIIKGGHELHRSEMFAGKVIDSYLPIGNDLFLAATSSEEEEQIKLYINHSCNPNVGIQGDRAFIAMRDISGGEELTIDYAFVDDEEYEFDCKCSSLDCRRKITGKDWKISAVQKKYGLKYFSQYLQNKIKQK